MWKSDNLYERIGIKPSATPEELKSRYHELVKAYHPDMIQDPKEKEEGQQIISAINEAYDILKDENKRREYDLQRTAGPNPFSPPRVNVFRQAVHLSFLESVFGIPKPIKLDMTELCSKCHGNCTHDGNVPPTCQTCRGAGFIASGFLPMPCPVCGGRGFVVTNPCKKCGGIGQTPKPETIVINIPPGVEQGSVLNFDTPKGRVLVMCQVENDPLLTVSGNDIHITVPISLKTAMLGGSVKIPTLNGVVEKRVLPGTQPYDVERMTLSGNGGIRNLFIHYKVVIPRSLNPADKDKLRSFEENYMRPTNDMWNANLKDFERRLNEHIKHK